MPDSKRTLPALYAALGARCDATLAQRPDWPCHRGCDGCCHRLAGPPAFTRAEWEHLWPSFEALSPEVRAQIRERAEALASWSGGHVTCPMLDVETGACRVYAERPAICRSYGFSVSGRHGNWCERISVYLEERGDEGIVWINHDAVEREVKALSGATVGIVEWFRDHPEPG